MRAMWMSDNPQHVKDVAKSIKDRKKQIDELEEKISSQKKENRVRRSNDKAEETEYMELVVYHKNPIIRFFQKIALKIKEFIDGDSNIEQVLEPKIYKTKLEEAEFIANMDIGDYESPEEIVQAYYNYLERENTNITIGKVRDATEGVKISDINNETGEIKQEIKEEQQLREGLASQNVEK